MTSVGLAPPKEGTQIDGSNLLRLLVVDDDRAIRKALQDVAQSFGFTVFVAGSAEHAYRVLDSNVIDVILLDLRLPGADGLEALRNIKQRWQEVIVVVITSYGTVQSAVHAMKYGAYDFITKPFSMGELKILLERVVGLLRLKTENQILREKINSKRGFGQLVGHSPEMEKLYRIIAKASQNTHPVLIVGRSGSGKEVIARSIHFSGPFRDNPFIAVDCGSLVPSLLETELFGYVKGAFPGALQARQGLLSLAEGGTLLLDDVADLPIPLQGKLLRAIQEKEIQQIGSSKPTTINVRIVAATTRDLEQLVSRGEFRKDLFFRLSVLVLRVPPLSGRRQDIPLLAAYFLERISRSGGHELTLSDDTLKIMLAYDWPGNVRELENCIERACALTSGPIIYPDDLPPNINRTSCVFVGEESSPKIISMTELERQTILSTITQLNGDKLLAARLLGIGKTTLYRRLKEYASPDFPTNGIH